MNQENSEVVPDKKSLYKTVKVDNLTGMDLFVAVILATEEAYSLGVGEESQKAFVRSILGDTVELVK